MPGLRTLAALLSALALAASASEGRGTIVGAVDAKPERYLDETVVFLRSVPGTFAPAVKEMDQKGMKFHPPLLTVTAGDTVRFLNHDSVEHGIYSPDHEGFKLGVFKAEDVRSHTFGKPGVYSILCSIHPEMQGYVFVGENPYAAPVDAKGRFELKDVPAGAWALAVWNSHLKGAEKPVVVEAGKTVEERLTLRR